MQQIIRNVKKIAVLRANALGDFFFAYPALCALKNTYKDAELIYLGIPWHKAFLTSRPSPIDRCIVVPKTKGIREEKQCIYNDDEQRLFFEEIKNEKIDVAIQMHGGGKFSNRFINNIGAKITVGFCTPDAELLDRWIPYDLYQNEFAKYLEAVSLIGAQPKNIFPFFMVTDSDRKNAQKYIKSKPFIVLHPGASDHRRRWPPKYFAEIGNFFVNKGYDVFITGTDVEKDVSQEVNDSMEQKAINLCGLTSLSALTGIFSFSSLVIANDTGPLHLADAIGAKTVGIYWVGNAMSSSPLIRKGRKVAFSWTIHCPVCQINCLKYNCGHKVSFVEEVKPNTILENALDLLSII